MSTGDNSTDHFTSTVPSNSNQRSIKKVSRITKRKTARKNNSHPHFRFGGNRKDPLNLNGLIQKKQRLAQAALSGTTSTTDTTDNHGNDRPVELLLQPDIFDPLRLDPSSRTDEDFNNIYSTPSTSSNPIDASNSTVYPIREKRFMNKRRHSQPPRYGNFQGYYGYRQPHHDQRLQYLQHEWFHEKQVLDIGCHTGHVTFYVAEHFQPRQIVGLDIDQQLVQQARHQLWNHIQTTHQPPRPPDDPHQRYPFNLRFQQGY